MNSASSPTPALTDAPPPLPVGVAYDPLARFRRKIGENARYWRHLLESTPAQEEAGAVDQEFANLYKAVEQALAEPSAWEAGLDLAGALWPVVSGRGFWLEWAEVLGRAQTAARRLVRPAIEAQILDQRGELARFLGDAPQALDLQSQALALFRRLGDDESTGRVLNHLSQAHMTLGEYTAAQACCQEAATIFEATGNQAELAQTHLRWGLICAELTRWDEALGHHRTAEQIFVALEEVGGQAMALNNQGHVLRLREDFPGAIDAFERAMAMHGMARDEINEARSRVNLGIVYDSLGDPRRALALHREVEPLFRRLGDRPSLARVLNNQGVFLRDLGQPDAAAEAFGQAVTLHLQNGNNTYAVMTLLTLAQMRINLGDIESARGSLGEAEGLLAVLPHAPKREMERLREMMRMVKGEDRQE